MATKKPLTKKRVRKLPGTYTKAPKKASAPRKPSKPVSASARKPSRQPVSSPRRTVAKVSARKPSSRGPSPMAQSFFEVSADPQWDSMLLPNLGDGTTAEGVQAFQVKAKIPVTPKLVHVSRLSKPYRKTAEIEVGIKIKPKNSNYTTWEHYAMLRSSHIGAFQEIDLKSAGVPEMLEGDMLLIEIYDAEAEWVELYYTQPPNTPAVGTQYGVYYRALQAKREILPIGLSMTQDVRGFRTKQFPNPAKAVKNYEKALWHLQEAYKQLEEAETGSVRAETEEEE